MHQAKRPTANGDRRLLTVVQLLGAMPKLAMIWRLQDAERRRERGALQEGLALGGLLAGLEVKNLSVRRQILHGHFGRHVFEVEGITGTLQWA